MIFDDIFIKTVLNASTDQNFPSSRKGLSDFFDYFNEQSRQKTTYAKLMSYVFYNALTSEEIRDRKVTARVAEDIICGIFGSDPTDKKSKKNPIVTEKVKSLNEENKFDFNFAEDFAKNKREKADHFIDDYQLSIKTLKGQLYDENYEIKNSKKNDEVNVGALSYRSLFCNILPDSELASLRDRKGGLGSNKQLREKVISKMDDNMKSKFFNRFITAWEYVYSEDILIIQKSGFKIFFKIIKKEDFLNLWKYYAIKNDVTSVFNILHRWENNNLRMILSKFISALKSINIEILEWEINLTNEEKILEDATKALTLKLKEVFDE